MLNSTLTALYKKIILDNGLYDTGALYRSASVYTEITPEGINCLISAMYYLEYHLVPYSIDKQFTTDPIFKLEMEKLFAEKINTMLSASINSNTAFSAPKIKLSLDHTYVK